MSVGKIIQPANLPTINRLSKDKELGVAQNERQPNVMEKFGNMLAEGVNQVNKSVRDYEGISTRFAQGERVNLHELILKGEQADIGLKLMVSMRNKVVEAYQEIMRLPV